MIFIHIWYPFPQLSLSSDYDYKIFIPDTNSYNDDKNEEDSKQILDKSEEKDKKKKINKKL